ncbi:DUF389 domain-containing protein [Kitasatospora sp. RB6PN24]|uniref:DUF389 domain-containing protein n=1 Tax=Kitasatospora humi TaxID=2893891 RepID=UPI001E43E044|nr:DUF389 domain-containing protein [Kitasatospora humi]MCC9306008.1 DUF389 domain-containing protein [Kitasatospora humi]
MGLVHLRLVSPPGLSDELVDRLTANRHVLNVVRHRATVRSPAGDALECDVLRGAANEVLGLLRELGVDRDGSITVDDAGTVFSARAQRLEAEEPTALLYAPLWSAVEARIREEGTYLPSFYLLLVIAGLIGSVGILTNSQILIVAAMVVGPEYNAILSVALGLDRRNRRRVRQGLLALALGFLLAIAVTLAFSLLVRGFQLEPRAYRLGLRPVSNLIDTPNFFSLVVAVLAGVVGIVSITEARGSALLGVFISVTTIPAASDIAVSLAFDSWHEAWGSLLQLLLNVVVLIVVGLAVLRAVRRIWRRVARMPRPAP